ncbi:putative 11-S seed storage protein, plant [Medicago truncatula]|uniref:Glutelin type-B-like protein n=1 Tax=Medicago truncatula TaxID=3880 RepID=G7L8W2_MEDTR|nr:glutelin type-B 5 [Medicago truncatula]AET04452.2 glutelin type-B-like protein [Medicago truncatula]RHN42789.1 putative 11-S seed storage protein, plant [Medicago truncatula]
MPVLASTNVGAGRLVLKPQGFALPHYADSSKVAYVIQGTDGVVGTVLPNTEKEVVLKLKQGDIIPVPIGTISWWYNEGGSDLIVVFLGETSNAHVPGQFTYFLLTGGQGIIGSFSNELTSKVYNLNKDEVNKLTKSQTGLLLVKLEKDQPMPKPTMDLTKKLVLDIDVAKPGIEVQNGGSITTITESEFHFIGDVGLSVIKVKLESNTIKAPSYLVNPLVQLIYIARGYGKIEIVGLNGKRVSDTQVKPGHLIVVPKFFVIAQIAGEEGMESYSIVTTTKPLSEELAGMASIWISALPHVLFVRALQPFLKYLCAS